MYHSESYLTHGGGVHRDPYQDVKLEEKQWEIYPGLSSTGKDERLYSNNWSMHSLYKFVGDVGTFSI